MSSRFVIGKLLLKLPLLRYKQFVYSLLGVKCAQKGNRFFIGNPRVIGDYSNICMHENSEIERCCFLLAKDRIKKERTLLLHTEFLSLRELIPMVRKIN